MNLFFRNGPESTTSGAAAASIPYEPFYRRDLYSILMLCGLCLLLLFFRLGGNPLWDVDEGMHAATSKDMVLTGDWVTTRVNGVNFYDKTVLFNWFAALSFVLFGFTEFAARLPAALLGLGTVLATYLLGRRMFGSRIGLLGGAVLATSPEFIVLSRTVMHDISLAFFVTLALSFFYRAYSAERRRTVSLILFYASLGFAVLAKGPIGLILPAMVIGLFLLMRGRLAFLKEMLLVRGTLVFLAIAAPWYVLISMRNADYVSYFFLKQNLGNFLSKVQATHPRPFYFYIPALLGGMLPWAFFAPLAVFRPLRRGFRQIDDASLFLCLWFFVIFLFFSAATSKLETYILPAFPAVAILIARIWQELMTKADAGLRRGAFLSLAPLIALLLAGTAYIMLRQPIARKLELQYGMRLYDCSAFFVVITAILLAALLLLFLRQYHAAFIALSSTFVAGLLVLLVLYLPAIDPYRSTVNLAKQMDRLLPPGEKLVFFSKLRDSALFYTDRRATILYSENELRDHLNSGTTALCVIEKEQYRQLPQIVGLSSVLGEEGNKVLIAGTARDTGKNEHARD